MTSFSVSLNQKAQTYAQQMTKTAKNHETYTICLIVSVDVLSKIIAVAKKAEQNSCLTVKK